MYPLGPGTPYQDRGSVSKDEVGGWLLGVWATPGPIFFPNDYVPEVREEVPCSPYSNTAVMLLLMGGWR